MSGTLKSTSLLSGDLVTLGESDLGASLGPTYLMRGHAYWKHGAVLKTECNSDFSQIQARVQGSRRTPYAVAIELHWTGSKWRIDGDCSCPVGFNCKHVAAVLLSVINGGEINFANMLSPRLAHWLRDLEGALAPPPEVKTGQQVVLYLLKVMERQNPPRPRVSLYVTKKLKSGYFGAGREKDFSMFSGRGLDCLTEDDYEIANLLLSNSRYDSWYDDGYLPQAGEVFDSLLKRLIHTGRCHFQHAKNPPLQFGDSKHAQIIWQPTPDGRQAPQLQVDGNATIMWGEKPWYVDQQAGLAGPLVLPMPFKVAEVMLAAPPLSANDVSKVYGALSEFQSRLAIPLPKTEKEFELRKIAPTVHLKLSSEPKPYFQKTMQTKADLSFDYGQYHFPPNQSHIEIDEGGKTVVLKPDREAEQDSIQKLHNLGLIQISSPAESAKQFDVRGDDERLGWIQFSENIDKLRELNWQVDIDSSFVFNAVSYDGEWQYDVEEDSTGWFNLDLGIEFEGSRISLLPIIVAALQELRNPKLELSTLNVNGKFFVKMTDGRLLGLPFERVEKILSVLIDLYDREGGASRISLAQALDLAAVNESILEGCRRLKEIATRLKNFTGIADVKEPADLLTELRTYQKTGFSWLQFIAEFDLGGVLADDMGLGKTVQTIAHMLAEKQDGKLTNSQFLIVCPTSVVPNWISELNRFAPKLRTTLLHGNRRAENFQHIKTSDVVITSYALLTRDLEQLKKHRWRGIIMDEAQNIKNPATKMAQSACSLEADHRICLTGTPVENHLGELWSQFHFLNPGMLGNPRVFSELFRVPIERQGNMGRQKLLASRIKPFMIRRTKLEVEKDLPPKTIIVKPTELEGHQRDLYELIRVSMHKKVQNEIASKGLARSQIAILEALLRLRQVCCDPRLVKLDKAKSVTGSSKLNALTDMLSELVAAGRKVLLFSQFTSMLDLIEPELNRLRLPFVQIRGDTKDRTTPVKRFQAGDVPVFLLSLKAGGTGLNLTAADTVIHYDPWWNPAVEDQATDRAYRIGQDKPVFVYKLIASGTIEEKMLELQERKRKIADSIYHSDTAISSIKFDEKDLEYLFQPIESF
jgi:SNF2 family DNA or RNA helicase